MLLVQKSGAIQNPADINAVDESGVRLSNEVGKLLVGASLVNSGIQNHLMPTPFWLFLSYLCEQFQHSIFERKRKNTKHKKPRKRKSIHTTRYFLTLYGGLCGCLHRSG